MPETPKNGSQGRDAAFSRRIGAKETRKLRAQRHAGRGVWSGLGTIGIIGWSVALPTLLGAALGIWLDRRYSGKYSWTLMLLVIGIGLGCWNAAHWVAQQHKEIQREQENGRDE